jgi:hypothetical protein
MTGLTLLLIVAVGLYMRGGRHFDWSRASLRRAAERLSAGGERLVFRGLRALPPIAGQCIVDMRALVDDTLGLVDPKARKRIEQRARGVLARAERRGLAAHAPGVRGVQRLQRSYLSGAITLERYVEEAERLRQPD